MQPAEVYRIARTTAIREQMKVTIENVVGAATNDIKKYLRLLDESGNYFVRKLLGE